MKFVVDAPLPARLARFLTDAGHDCVHTSQLPTGNRTTDARIKDERFVEMTATNLVVHREPKDPKPPDERR